MTRCDPAKKRKVLKTPPLKHGLINKTALLKVTYYKLNYLTIQT